jgi:hypothetical protein
MSTIQPEGQGKDLPSQRAVALVLSLHLVTKTWFQLFMRTSHSQTNCLSCMSLKLTEQLVSTARSPGLTINLSSNNPFRNRATSPTLSPQLVPPRPVSRNPFLDASGAPISTSPTMSQTNGATVAPKPLTGHAAELFVRHSRLSIFSLPPELSRRHLRDSSIDFPLR